MSGPPVFWLSMHQPYACRHAGRCCSSGWDIPIEPAQAASVRLLRRDEGWLRPVPDAPSDVAGVLTRTAAGHCVFHHDGCEIQHHLSHEALPVACQHFPREVLIDRRGVFVTLSHYCPTAADLLLDHAGPVQIVAGPPVLPRGEPQGLDARDVLPPLLCEGVLMDDEGYSAWESHMVRILTAEDGGTPEDAVATLAQHAATLQRWRPGRTTLADAVRDLHPPALRSSTVQPRAAEADVIRRFLAAHAFASWMPYQGGGIGAGIGLLEIALETLRAELTAANAALFPRERLKIAVAATDLRLRHLMPRDHLAQAASVRYRSRR